MSNIAPIVPGKPALPSGFYGVPSLGVMTSRSTFAVVVNRMYYAPFFCHEVTDITAVQAVVSTLGSGSSVRLGICEWDSETSQPTILVRDFGSIDATSTGAKEIEGTVTLREGKWYAFITLAHGAGCTLARVYSQPVGAVQAVVSGTNWNLPGYHYKADSVQGAAGFSADQSSDTDLTIASLGEAGVMFTFLAKY